MDERNKTLYNIGGGIIGILMAALAIFGLIQTQTGDNHPQYSSKISYDG